MSTTSDEALEIREPLAALAEASTDARMVVRPDGETIELGHDHRGQPKPEGIFDAQGRVPLHIIRPTVGRGRGRHLYEAGMLADNAAKFSAWRMYVNHRSPEARKQAGGLPRDVQDLGGRITESWWDPTVPGDARFGEGAVVGMARPTPQVGALIDHDPELIEASISATATGVRPSQVGGQKVWVVEGINDKGSVDWVTEAGAGGRVAAIIQESAADQETEGPLIHLDDSAFIDHLRTERPHLAGALLEARDPSEEDDMEITPEVLAEAIRSDEGRSVIGEILQETVAPLVEEGVEATLSRERDIIRAEARADADRQIQLRDLRDEAKVQIAESRLPDAFRQEVESKFTLGESGPLPGLDVIDEINDEGEVTKTASDVLGEAVTAEIQRARALVATVRPTRVTGQGPNRDGGEKGDEKRSRGTLYGAVLQEAGIDPDTAYAEA